MRPWQEVAGRGRRGRQTAQSGPDPKPEAESPRSRGRLDVPKAPCFQLSRLLDYQFWLRPAAALGEKSANSRTVCRRPRLLKFTRILITPEDQREHGRGPGPMGAPAAGPTP